MHKISEEGLAHIKRWEGLELHAYRDVAGILTIGYGHTGDVTEDMEINEARAEALLRSDVAVFEDVVNGSVRPDITQSQFDALVSFAFNVGASAMRGSTAVRRLNAGDVAGAAEALTWWNKARVDGKLRVIEGLKRRRAAEAEMLLDKQREGILEAPGKCLVL